MIILKCLKCGKSATTEHFLKDIRNKTHGCRRKCLECHREESRENYRKNKYNWARWQNKPQKIVRLNTVAERHIESARKFIQENKIPQRQVGSE